MRKPPKVAGAGLYLSEQAWHKALSQATSRKQLLLPRFRISPNRILGLRLKSRNDYQKKTYARLFRFGAAVNSVRLPILTLQAFLAKQDLSSEDKLAEVVAAKDKAEWQDTLNVLAGRGWDPGLVEKWVWIVSAENGDARVERLVSTEEHNPVFLLMLLLRRDEVFKKTDTIISLVRYISRRHIAKQPRPSEVHVHPTVFERNKLLHVLQFRVVIQRFAHHVRRVWPRAIVTVARLTIRYIKSLPNVLRHLPPGTIYYYQCLIFNTVLGLLTIPTPNYPLAHMEFNWRAQRLLLAMSEKLHRPFIIDQTSYQSIRTVLIGLRKSREEKAVAIRYAETWPPYRRDFNAQDTIRTAEDDKSRSVKAGTLMVEAGYSANEYDQALDALGGTGEYSPTIQTRSLPPTGKVKDRQNPNKQNKGEQIQNGQEKEQEKEKENENEKEKGKQKEKEKENTLVYVNWAMQVRSTRNAQEAWRVFNLGVKKTGLAPNVQVYNEMFMKIHATPADMDLSPDLLPGDARETFPVYDANYSEYELARLAPPTVRELYADMRSHGIKPSGSGLIHLVSNARSIEDGLHYLEDSGIPSSVIEEIALYRTPPHNVLQRIPLVYFKSYIDLLSRLQPDRRMQQDFFPDELYRIRHAVVLTTTRLIPDSTTGATFRPPWHTILRALARPHIAIANGPAVHNDLESLIMFMDTLRTARKCVGMDAELFILLCRVIQKAALSRLISVQRHGEQNPEAPLIPFRMLLFPMVTSAFEQLTTAVSENLTSSLASQFQYPLGPPHFHSYMRALAFLDARDDMVKLLLWMFDNHTYVNEEANRLSGRGRAMIAKTLCAFQALAGPALEENVQKRVNERMDRLIVGGGLWRWPTSEETDEYINADKSGGSELLHRRAVEIHRRAVASFENRMLFRVVKVTDPVVKYRISNK
ncbi:hypothetical protein GGR50DRAFT_677242 [Xylaria sp. CBS 124048]|nr:hypothetical protein GGR50DRAFT_677242 [Xylaria sp. CBS 124048]